MGNEKETVCITDEMKEMRLREMVAKEEDLNECVGLYLDLYEDTDVMHQKAVESEINELVNHDGREESMEQARRLGEMLDANPSVTYFDYYKEEPITFLWLRERLGMGDPACGDGSTPASEVYAGASSPYSRAIEVLSDNGFGQDLSTVLVACACRNAMDDYEEETKDLDFTGLCYEAEEMWLDCEDRTSLCVIADWLVQWHIRRPDEEWPTDYPALKEWAEGEGI